MAISMTKLSSADYYLDRTREALQADGYTIVPISQLLLSGEYSIDHTGRMHPAA